MRCTPGPWWFGYQAQLCMIEKKKILLLGKLRLFQSLGWTLDFTFLHAWVSLSSEQPRQLSVEDLADFCPNQMQLYLWRWHLGNCSLKQTKKKSPQMLLKELRINSFDIDIRERKLQYLTHFPFIHLPDIHWATYVLLRNTWSWHSFLQWWSFFWRFMYRWASLLIP